MSNTGPFRSLLRDHARVRQILRILTDADFHAKAVKPSPYGLADTTANEFKEKTNPIAAHAARDRGENQMDPPPTRVFSQETDPTKNVADHPRTEAHSRLLFANLLIREVSQHSVIEEEALYPMLKKVGEKAGPFMAERSWSEHRSVKKLLNQLDGLGPRHPAFDPTLRNIEAELLKHIQEEESEVFPYLEKKMSREDLEGLAKTLERLRPFAPTRPHPLMPDHPPANALLGALVAVVDRVRDLGKSFPTLK